MHFEITASLQSLHKHLTPAQRNSSLFSEAPRIGAVTLRRGQTLRFDRGQMKQHEVILKRLLDAGAIEIVQVNGKERISLREAMRRNHVVLDDVRKELKKEEPTPEKVEALEALPPAPELTAELTPVEEDKVPLDTPKVTEVPTESAFAATDNKGKKGRR